MSRFNYVFFIVNDENKNIYQMKDEFKNYPKVEYVCQNFSTNEKYFDMTCKDFDIFDFMF